MGKINKIIGKKFALECYVDEKRKLSHQLTKKEAKIFHTAAMNLAEYLATSYKFKGDHALKCISQAVSLANSR